MELQIIAKSDKGTFIGRTAEDGFSVITLDDTIDIDTGDVLKKNGSWDDAGGLFIAVKNATQGETVSICLEGWQMSFDAAERMICRLGNPTEVHWLKPWPDCGRQ